MTLLQPQRTIVPGTAAHRLARGVLRVEGVPPYTGSIGLVDRQNWSSAIVDTGDGDEAAWIPDGDVTIHVLWQAHEQDASVTVDGVDYPIAPGDTMTVPGGVPTHRTSGMLLVQIEASGRAQKDVLAPGHGQESFDGYNRRTDYDTPTAFSLERWKITQPLTIPSPDSAYALVCLTDPLAVVWTGGVDLIGRGECRVIHPSSGPVTLLPGGLGYALIIREGLGA